MGLSSYVISRFSHRGYHQHEGARIGADPLEPERLELRFKIFEITCLPSILGQTDQDFAWVIIVDRALPAIQRERLESLTRRGNLTVLQDFDPHADLMRLDWLPPDARPTGDRVLTINLDDDDALPRRFVGAARRRLSMLEASGALPPIAFLGAKRIVQWDFATSSEAPLGWRAPWHRPARVASAGFALCCRFPQFNFCAEGLRHRLAERYVDFTRAGGSPDVRVFQQEILRISATLGEDVRAWSTDSLFFDVSAEAGPVLMTNHAVNDQADRLEEAKEGMTVVTGPADFPEVAIDWEKARRYADSFRR